MKRAVTGAQNVSRMCFVCGRDNPFSLKARFYELEGGELLGVFGAGEGHQGYPGRLQGGVASAMLDETIGRAIGATEPDTWGATVELSVRYRKPVPLGREVRAIGRITSDSRMIFEGTGEIVLADGTVAVEATGKYLKLPIERIAEGDFETEWFADERPAPRNVDL